jgi:dimethylglycine dehydrogenase
VHGEAQHDTWVIVSRRFTGHANMERTALKAIGDCRNEFRLPHEHRPAGRPMKTTPPTPIRAAEGAEFGVVNGLEQVACIKPAPDFHETRGFRFNKTFDVVAAEVKAVHSGVGLTEVNGFSRLEITGPGARDWLDSMFCGPSRERSARSAPATSSTTTAT